MFEGKEVSSGRKVAIKQISSEKVSQFGAQLIQAIRREIEVLMEVSKFMNPYLLCILDFFETKKNKYMVLEYCDGGDLFQKMRLEGAFDEPVALEIAYQVSLGLKALADLKVIHRDMKPENIFINNGVFKIGDFGFANIASKFESTLGTRLYMAPEFFVGEGSLTNAVDV